MPGNCCFRSIIAEFKQNRARRIAVTVSGATGERIAALEALGPRHLADERLIDLLTRWRRQAMSMFFTQFEATADRTRQWLARLLQNDAQIMFLILSSTDEPLGQYGLRWDGEETVELDGGILGATSGPPRLFFHVQRTLLDWLFITFETRRVTARVLSKNAFAIKLHKSLGLEPIAFEPLALEVWAGGERRYRCVAPGTATDVPFQCITLEITRAAYLRQKAEAGRS